MSNEIGTNQPPVAERTVAQAISALSDRTTKEWADELCDHMHKFKRFQGAYWFFDASPRMIKGVIRHPELMRSLHEKHVRASKAYDPDVSEAELKSSFEEWSTPQGIESIINLNDIDRAVKCFDRGLDPVQTVQELFAENEDGEELSFDEACGMYGSSGTLLIGPIMVIAMMIVMVIGALTFYKHAAEQYESKPSTETSTTK